jgi:PII-like signaling protein
LCGIGVVEEVAKGFLVPFRVSPELEVVLIVVVGSRAFVEEIVGKIKELRKEIIIELAHCPFICTRVVS